MNKNTLIIIVLISFLLGVAVYGSWRNYGTVSNLIPDTGQSFINSENNNNSPASSSLVDSNNNTNNSTTDYRDNNLGDFTLRAPENFSVSILAKNLSDARVIVQDHLGNFWVSRPDAGVITLLEMKDGEIASQSDIFGDLNKPHGLAFDPDDPFVLYYAEEDKISKVRVYTEDTPQKIADLPTGGRHTTRTLIFGKDKLLYVSIGSSCDVCVERDKMRGKIFSMDKEGKNLKEYASGLRNSVFMSLDPKDGKIWATEMGRDYLGDNLPPDEVNIIEEGQNYGWPYCYGNRLHDMDFDPSLRQKSFCNQTKSPVIEIPAHSAPLGLSFIPEKNWPEKYRNNLLVAYHGSWNRTEAIGYKIVRYELDGQGKVVEQEDFITGWLGASGKPYGRPAGILALQDGSVLVTDDLVGIVYKISVR